MLGAVPVQKNYKSAHNAQNIAAYVCVYVRITVSAASPQPILIHFWHFITKITYPYHGTTYALLSLHVTCEWPIVVIIAIMWATMITVITTTVGLWVIDNNWGVPWTYQVCRHTWFLLETAYSALARSVLSVYAKIWLRMLKLRPADLSITRYDPEFLALQCVFSIINHAI